MESPDMNSYTYDQLIYDKGDSIYNGDKTVSSKSSTGKNYRTMCK